MAERHLRVAKEVVAKLGLRETALAALGHLDVRVVLHLTGQKKLYEDREFPDLDAIAQVMTPPKSIFNECCSSSPSFLYIVGGGVGT